MIKKGFIFAVLVLCSTALWGQSLHHTATLAGENHAIHSASGMERVHAVREMIKEYVTENPHLLPGKRLAKTSAWGFNVGSQRSWWGLDASGASDFPYEVPSTCRAVGEHCYIFVENASWEVGGTGRVTQAAVDAMVESFDNATPASATQGIYEQVVDYFGTPPDFDSDPKIIILLLDIKDGYTGSGAYTGGYFFSVDQIPDSDVPAPYKSNEAEIFYIDCDPVTLTDEGGLNAALGTIAHEFQHMVHYNNDPDELTFFDEGCAEVSAILCGYRSKIASRMGFYTANTNIFLPRWDYNDALVDYARAQRFFYYLWDQFPNDLLKNFVADPDNAVLGLTHALEAYSPSTSRRFMDIFEDWVVANYLNDISQNPRHGYQGGIYATPDPANEHYNPNVSGSDEVVKLACQYVSFKGGSNLSVTFTADNNKLKVKAIKVGSTEVDDVPLNSAYSVPDFGTTYDEVTFALINTSTTQNIAYSYTATGSSQSSAVEVAHDDGQPEGFLNLSATDTMAVWFPGRQGMTLDSLRIAFFTTGSMNMGIHRYSGSPRPTPLGSKMYGPRLLRCNTQTADPYPEPYENWVTVDLTNQNLDASQSFAVWFHGSNPSEPGLMVSVEPDMGQYYSYTYLDVGSGFNWYYLTGNDNTIYKYVVHAYVSSPSDVDDDPVMMLPMDYSLSENYPNPFNPQTAIDFTLPVAEHVTLTVYDAAGRQVSTLYNGPCAAGKHQVEFDASNLPSGLYVYRISAGQFVQNRKMILLK